MPTLVAGVVAVVVLYLLLQMFRAANPVVLARAIKIAGGVLSLAVAAYTGFRGELAVAIPLCIFGAGLLGWSPFGPGGFGNIGGIFGGGAQRSSGQASRDEEQDRGHGPRFHLLRAVVRTPRGLAERYDLLQPPLDRSFKKPGGYVMRDKLAAAREAAGQPKPKPRSSGGWRRGAPPPTSEGPEA